MKVKIKTGKRYRSSCLVDVQLTTFRGAPCIEIDAPIDLHPIRDSMERPEELAASYREIATALGFDNPSLDERDSRTMWIWKGGD